MTEKRLTSEGANGIANRVILVDLDGNPAASAGAVYARHARAIVTTAGAGVTPGWVLVKAVG